MLKSAYLLRKNMKYKDMNYGNQLGSGGYYYAILTEKLRLL